MSRTCTAKTGNGRRKSMARVANPADDRLDLRLDRTIAVPRHLIWKAWTEPTHIKKWWAPAPWSTVECQINLRPGGIFRTVMRSPEGQDFPHEACVVELIENERIMLTNALAPGYRPAADQLGADCASITFTAIVTFTERAGRTHYSVLVLHKDEAGRKRHEEMGFHEGWGNASTRSSKSRGNSERGQTPRVHAAISG
jgi:uncharacterized protein YndB with AHSA1/START domain